MAHKYDSIKKLDEEGNGGSGRYMPSIEDYMVPPP